MENNKLPKLLITSSQKKDYLYRDAYLCTVDREHRHKHEFKGEDGKDYLLYLPKDKSNDHREKHPNIGTVASATPGAQFPVGTTVLCKHFTFEEQDNTPRIFYEKDGEIYYRAFNFHVMFAIEGNDLVPREGILLCEPIMDKLYDTTLELSGDNVDYRRDIAKVIKVWEGCTDYEVGDYVLLNKGGDYPFDFNGKEYLKVDTYFNDVIAVVDSKEVRRKEVTKRVRDHSKPAH